MPDSVDDQLYPLLPMFHNIPEPFVRLPGAYPRGTRKLGLTPPNGQQNTQWVRHSKRPAYPTPSRHFLFAAGKSTKTRDPAKGEERDNYAAPLRCERSGTVDG